MSSGDPIPSSHFDALTLDPQVRAEAWREFSKELVDVTPLRQPQRDIRFSWDAWHIEDVFAYGFVDDCLIGQRTKKHISLSQGYLSIRVYKNGRSRGLLGDQVCHTSAGNVHVMDFSLERYGVDIDNVVDGVYVPQEAVGYDPSRHPASFNIPVDTPLGRTLSFAIQSLLHDLPDLRWRHAATVKARVLALLRAVFTQNGVDEEARAAFADARLGAMRQFVDRHLSDTTLGVDRLCRAFNVSRSTLFRIFAELGGVEAYIRERRTDHAFRDLLYSHPSRGAVGRIAEAWCFHSASHFHRQFRAQYGAQPSEILGCAAAGAELPRGAQAGPSWCLDR